MKRTKFVVGKKEPARVYVQGLAEKGNKLVIEFTEDIEKAQVFRNETELNSWLDTYVNCGMGLDWVGENQVTCWKV